MLGWLAVGLEHVRADGFSPSALAGLQWWASADRSQLAQNPDGTGTVINGDPVGFISDLSGNANNAIMGNAVVSGGDSYRPLLQTNLVGGNPGILFNGSTAFSSLQSSLFQGASSLTVAFAVEADNYTASNQYIFGSNSAPLGFVGYGNPYAAVQLNNGQSISLSASPGMSFNSAVGSDTTFIMIARFQPNGESDLWENGQLVSSTIGNASPAAAPQYIQSPNVKILGNINYGSEGGGTTAPQSTATRFFFLEGLASTTALSNDQVSQLYKYLSQQWPGVQEVSTSPNLYWDQSQNPQRAAPTTVNAGHIQGVASGDNMRIVFHTAMIEEYDRNWNLLNSNQAIGAGIVPPGTSLHSGDGDYAQGKIFAPLEQDLNGDGKGIAVYDATKPGMPLITFKPLTTTYHEFSSLTVVPTLGADGIVFATSFEPPPAGGDKLWMYDYAGGNVQSSSFGNFLGTFQIPTSITGIQGVAWKAPYFYFSAGNSSSIQRVAFQNGVLASQAEPVWTAPTTVQGLGFDGSNLLQVLQSGGTTEITWTLGSAKFATPVTPGSGFWNYNGDAPYSSNSGFDGMIPNGPGSTATFGGGTINTISAPTISVTVEGAYTLGSLTFSPTNGTAYTLAGDNVAGHGLTFDSGSASGTIVSVAAASHVISANITLADSGGHTFNIAPTSTLTVTGAIGEIGGSRAITMTGGGRLVLGSANSFSGGVTIGSGIVQTTANGALGGRAVTLSPPTGSSAGLYVGGSETISSLSAASGSPTAAIIALAPGANLNVRQAINTTVQGTLVTSGTFSKAGSGTLELDSASVMLLGSALEVSDSGTLRLNPTSGSATVTSGVTVSVADSATLELAGSISALSSGGAPVNRAAIVNNSSASPGVLVTGTSQIVGPIDGSGSVEVRAGSDLTATHIVQSALVIGGAPGSPATVTIAASDSLGNPLADSSSSLATGQTAPMTAAAGDAKDPSRLSAAASGSQIGSSVSTLLSSLTADGATFSSHFHDVQSLVAMLNSGDGSIADVPSLSGSGSVFLGGLEPVSEPTTALLFSIGLFAAGLVWRRHQR